MIFGEFTTKAGLIRVEILDSGTNDEVEINSIGNLKYEFDLIPDKPEVTSVQALYEKIDIEIFQFSHKNNDIYERLIDKIRSQDGVKVELSLDSDTFSFFIQLNDIELKEVDRMIKLECRVFYDNTTTVGEVFDAVPAGLTYTFLPDAANAGETLECTGVLDWVSQAMNEVFLNDFDSVAISSESNLDPNYNRTNYTSLLDGIKDKVGFIMADIRGTDFVTFEDLEGDGSLIRYLGNNKFSGRNFTDKIKADDRFNIVRDNGTFLLSDILINSVDSDEQFTSATLNPAADVNEGQLYRWMWKNSIDPKEFSAIEALQELATMEGAIFGTGFGRNFFVNRVLHQEIVDIPWDEITEIAPKPFWNPFGEGAVTQLARTYSDADNQTVNSGFENFGVIPISSGSWQIPLITDARVAIKDNRPSDYAINLSLPPGYPFLNKAKGEPAHDRYLGKYSTPIDWHIDFEPSLALCRAGLKAMRKALASDGKALYVELSAFNSKRVKPWNLFRIVDSISAPAPAKYKDKIFRSTNIEYDFVKDMASYEAYEILSGDVENPNLNIEVEGNAHASGSVEIEVTATKYVNVSGESSSSNGSVSFIKAKGISVSGESSASGGSVTTTTV